MNKCPNDKKGIHRFRVGKSETIGNKFIEKTLICQKCNLEVKCNENGKVIE